jgi:hypothetical protein
VKTQNRRAEPPHINVNITNRLVIVEDAKAAADLFSRILRAVRGEKADQERSRNDDTRPHS